MSTVDASHPAPFNVVSKPAGAACNLACRYCFYRDHTALYPHASFKMSDEVLTAYVRHTLRHAGPHAQFTWQGGEATLLGRDFFERALALQREFADPETDVHNALQTNGMLLDDDWCAWLKAHDFLVGVSLDGPEETHDANRVDRRGRPTFQRVMEGVSMLKRHGVRFNILTVVCAANVHRGADVYRFLRDEAGAAFMQFIPVVERDSAGALTAESITADQYGAFLCEVFDEWVQRDVGRVFVQRFDAALAAWAGEHQSLCVFAEECGLCPALEHNGDLYACDHFVDAEHLLGNILEHDIADLVASAPQRAFGRAKRTEIAEGCFGCGWRFACRGGCPKNRFVPAEHGPPEIHLCEGYRRFFAHVNPAMTTMSRGLSYGVGPAAYMTLLAVERGELPPSALGSARNDPCPCFGGKKFKRCHG